MNLYNRACALEVAGLCYRAGKPQLEGVSFRLDYGSIMALTATSAADAAVTLELLLGLKRKSAGSVRIFGADTVKRGGAVTEAAGVVLRREALASPLKAGELSRVMAGIYRRWNEQTFMQLVRRFVLPDNISTDRYSPAQRAKLALAAAMSHETRLLVLDEPVRGLDSVDSDELLECLLDFKSGGGSVLIASSEPEVIERIADGVTVLHDGKRLLSEDIDKLGEEYAQLILPRDRLAELDGGLIAGIRCEGDTAMALVHRADFTGGAYELMPVGLREVLSFCTGGEARE